MEESDIDKVNKELINRLSKAIAKGYGCVLVGCDISGKSYLFLLKRTGKKNFLGIEKCKLILLDDDDKKQTDFSFYGDVYIDAVGNAVAVRDKTNVELYTTLIKAGKFDYLKNEPEKFKDLVPCLFDKKYKEPLKSIIKIVKNGLKERVGEKVTEEDRTYASEIMTIVAEKTEEAKKELKKAKIDEKEKRKFQKQIDKEKREFQKQIDKGL